VSDRNPELLVARSARVFAPRRAAAPLLNDDDVHGVVPWALAKIGDRRAIAARDAHDIRRGR
jgi:hypothetical protein